MKTLYLDCNMGAAGDMLTAALLELFPDPDAILSELNRIGIPDVVYKREKTVKCGVSGTRVKVLVGGREEGDEAGHTHEHGDEAGHAHGVEHHYHGDGTGYAHGAEHHHHGDEAEHTHVHRSLADIEGMIAQLHVSEKVKKDAAAIYRLLAEAESHAHDRPVSQIHFHEVGAADAVADITAVCVLMERLGVYEVITSRICVGSGHVHCAHGILPVPAPATAYILQGMPVYGGELEGELCTPTGAALLKYFATRSGELPAMTIAKTGYGMGKKDFPRVNCVRAMLGESLDDFGEVLELSCNVDDMTGEAVGFAMNVLLEAGALDVFTIPAGMKKNRPGVLINVICEEKQCEEMVRLLLKHTTTLGVRQKVCRRYTMERSQTEVETSYGTVRRKDAVGFGAAKSKYEYEDLMRIAKREKIGIREAEALVREEAEGKSAQ